MKKNPVFAYAKDCRPRAVTTKVLALVFAFVLALASVGCVASSGSSGTGSAASSASASAASHEAKATSSLSLSVEEDGQYSDKDHVALYIHTYGHLPSNYISKTKARKAGWVNTEGNLWDVLPGMSIGGSVFHAEDEEALPYAEGRTWTECDIDFNGGYRNAKRIVFSNDGLIFYTDDHYKTFEQLY